MGYCFFLFTNVDQYFFLKLRFSVASQFLLCISQGTFKYTYSLSRSFSADPYINIVRPVFSFSSSSLTNTPAVTGT